MHGTEALVKVGVTVMVAVSVEGPEFVTLKDEILPDPEAARPIEGVSLIQSKEVVPPVLVDEKLTGDVAFPLHSI